MTGKECIDNDGIFSKHTLIRRGTILYLCRPFSADQLGLLFPWQQYNDDRSSRTHYAKEKWKRRVPGLTLRMRVVGYLLMRWHSFFPSSLAQARVYVENTHTVGFQPCV